MMVNILKHRKINKNPFVTFLKDFIKNNSINSKIEPKEVILDDTKSVIITENEIKLIDSKYDTKGFFIIDIENLFYKNGDIYFKLCTTPHADTFCIFCEDIKEFYELLYEFENLSDSNQLDDLIYICQVIGLSRQQQRGLI